MSILSFDKPQKSRPFKEHAARYSSDSGIAGTYVPNMSHTDMLKWKAKHIKGKDERVEIRKTVDGVQMVIVVYKNEKVHSFTDPNPVPYADEHRNVRISANGKIQLSFDEWGELVQAINEAKAILYPNG